MTGFRYRRGAGLTALSLLLVSSLALEAAAPAAAAARPLPGTRVAAAELSKAVEPAADGGTLASKGASDEEPGCLRARKRLWVEGEGWIVRRVTTCR